MRATPIALLLALVAVAPRVAAETDEKVFADATLALERGAHEEAIDLFEWLADRGFVHPDASFNRAAAYISRATSSQPMAGDLGRAAAALTEATLLRPDDEDAQAGLERVREEIARRRANRGGQSVEVRPSLGWAVVGLLSEDAWAAMAALGSALLTIGLALRVWLHARWARLSGAVAAGAGVVLLVGGGLLAAFARDRRIERAPAVVVVAEARLLQESGAPQTGKTIVVPEGAEVSVIDQRGQLAHVEWGTAQGWVGRGQLRVVARPRD